MTSSPKCSPALSSLSAKSLVTNSEMTGQPTHHLGDFTTKNKLAALPRATGQNGASWMMFTLPSFVPSPDELPRAAPSGICFSQRRTPPNDVLKRSGLPLHVQSVFRSICTNAARPKGLSNQRSLLHTAHTKKKTQFVLLSAYRTRKIT